MKRLYRFLVWAYLPAWLLQIIGIFRVPSVFPVLWLVSLLVPGFAVFLSGGSYAQMGWEIHWDKVIGTIGRILSGVVCMAVLGAGLYFVFFSSSFRLSVGIGPAILFGLTFLPFFHGFFALGEETGWRGYVYPILKDRYGILAGRIVGGILWGFWHVPVLVLTSSVYGPGTALSGPVLWCVYAVTSGIVLDSLCDRTSCIWAAAYAHGALHAVSSLSLLFFSSCHLVLGPALTGLLSGLPLLGAALWISFRR